MPSFARRAALTGAFLAFALSGCASSVSLDEPVEGPAWRLVQLEGQPLATDPQRTPFLQFDGGARRLSGSGGCNRLSGSYQREGSTLRIGQVAATRMACLDPAQGQIEQRFLSVLQATAGYRLGNHQLSLLSSNGQTLAVLQAPAAR